MCVSVCVVCVCVCEPGYGTLGGGGLLQGGHRWLRVCGGPEKALILVTGTRVSTLPVAG